MARIRTVKPSFFTSMTIGELDLSARLTFIGLWTYVDDKGRAVDDARLVKAALWALDDRQTVKRVDDDLLSLEKRGFIERYVVDGRRYLRVRNWEKHQRINRPQASTLPPSPEEVAGRGGIEPPPEPPENLSHHEPFTDSSVNAHGADTEDSLPEGKGKERKGTSSAPISDLHPDAVTPAGGDGPTRNHVPAQVLKALRSRSKSEGWNSFDAAMKRYATDGTLDEFVEMAERFPDATADQLPQLLDRGPLFRQFVEREAVGA